MTLLLSLGLMAQDQGSVLLSGSTGLNFTSLSANDYDPKDYEIDENSISTLDLDVSFGYFVMDGLAVGLSISTESSTTKLEDDGYKSEMKESSTTIAPMARYYIAETGLYSQLSYGFGSSKTETDNDGNNSDSETKLSILGIGLGYNIFVSDNVALSPSLTYSMVKTTVEDGAIDDNFNDVDLVVKSGGINFGLGVTVFLGN